MKKINLIIIAIVITSFTFITTENGELRGTIQDIKSNKLLSSCYISLSQGEVVKEIILSDIDGNFYFKDITPGYYSLLCTNTLLGYDSLFMDSLWIKAGSNKKLQLKMKPNTTRVLKTIKITKFKEPILKKDASKHTMTGESLKKTRTRKVGKIASLSKGVKITSDGSISYRGSRSDATAYYVDGAKVIGEEASEESTISDSEAVIEDKKVPETPSKSKAQVLTAGETKDFNKWNLWEDLSSGEMKQHTSLWGIIPNKRFTVQILNKIKLPLVDKIVRLTDDKGNTLFEAKTDNTGKAELWLNLINQKKQLKSSKLTIVAEVDGKPYSIKRVKEFKDGINTIKVDTECNQSNVVDILFTVDATGSMGDEINYLKSDMGNLIMSLEEKNPSLSFNYGSVFYRDSGDAYLVKKQDLNNNKEEFLSFLNMQSANGGGDFPEAVDVALETAINQMNWSENARTRIMFVLLDAPPHSNPETVERMRKLTVLAAKKNIRIVPIGCSGIDKSTEYLMRSLALATNGNYIFLTDHSGVGDSHIKASTDEYKVETLNDVMSRTIDQFIFIPSCENKTKKDVKRDTLIVSTPKIIDHVILDSSLIQKPDSLDNDSSQIIQNPKDTIQQIVFKAYPNPTHGPLTIEVSEDIKTIYISDFTGKILQIIEVSKNQKLIKTNLEQFASGTYLIKAWQNNKWVFGKIILSHHIIKS